MMIMMTIFEMIFLTSGSINEHPSRRHTNILPRTWYIIKHFVMIIKMSIMKMEFFFVTSKAIYCSHDF